MAQTLEPLLLQSARLSVQIRKTYKVVKKDQAAKYYTYVLLLQNNKMYVGNTDNIYNRLLDHCLMSPASSVWVRQHGPVQRVVEIMRNCSREDEAYKTFEYMTLFGWKNVRGGSYCRPYMRSPPPTLGEWRRQQQREFDHLTRAEIDEVVTVVRDLANSNQQSGDEFVPT